MDNDGLVKRLKEGDEKAYEILIEKYSSRIFNLSLGVLRNQEWADDMAQEVFIEVYKSISKFREESSLDTWIYRVTLNKCLNFEKKQRRLELMDAFNLLSVEKRNYLKGEASHPGISEENKELEKWVFSNIAKLPKSQRIAITLHKIQGLKQTEIGDIMDISISAVESLVFRGMKKLKNSAKNEGLIN